MSKEFRTTRQIMDEEGTISSPGFLSLPVRFDLIEMQETNLDEEGRRFSYGHLRFRDRLEASVVSLFRAKSQLILAGGGIQATVCLHNLNSFTVLGIIEQTVLSGTGRCKEYLPSDAQAVKA